MIKNLVSDMGNVLLNFDPQVSLDAFCGSEREKEVIRRELFEGPEWVQGDLGAIRDRDRFELVKVRVPEESWEALKKCCEGWHACMEPLPGAREFCRAVKDMGCRLFILSNASDAFYEYFPRLLPLDFFDGIVVSADIHLLKPGREIYEYLLNKYGLQAVECLFIDDMPQNVEGAIAAGMRAMQFRGGYEQVLQRLSEPA